MSKSVPGFTLNSFVSPGFGNKDSKWYKDILYSDAKSIIKEKMVASAENFVAIGYYLKQIWEKEQYKEDGYESIWECAYAEFQLSQSAASRYINICKKFSANGDSPMLDDKYRNFNRSQLQEMLTIKDAKVLEEIKPEMTTREIRKRSIQPDNLSDETTAGQHEKLPGQMTIEGNFREFIPKENNPVEYMPEAQESVKTDSSVKYGQYKEDSQVVTESMPVNISMPESNFEEELMSEVVQDVYNNLIRYAEQKFLDVDYVINKFISELESRARNGEYVK